MHNGLDHTVLLVLCKLRHEPEIKDAKFAVGGADHVAWVRVGMEKTLPQKLREVCHDAQVDKVLNVVCFTLRKFLAVHPLGDVDPTTGVVRVALGDHDVGQ